MQMEPILQASQWTVQRCSDATAAASDPQKFQNPRKQRKDGEESRTSEEFGTGQRAVTLFGCEGNRGPSGK